MIRALLAALCLAAPANAQCRGLPLDSLLPPAQQQQIIDQRLAAAPLSATTTWRATRDGQQIIITVNHFGTHQDLSHTAQNLLQTARASDRIFASYDVADQLA